MLFQGWDNDPTWDEALEISNIMGSKIKNTNRTTALYVRGDFDFYGTGRAYLGVLKNLQMPGQLSEGSFHDYIPESWRLMNLDYRRHEAWAITKTFIEYFEAGELSHGIIAGLVRDAERSVEYGYITGADKRLPLNNITVTVKPGNHIYNGDHNNNGFFMIDSLAPGDYTVIMDAPHYHADSLQVTVTANQTVFADINLKSDSTYVGEPETPTHIQSLVQSDASVLIKFRSSSNSDGYRVYYGVNPSSLDDYVESDTTEVLVEGLSEGLIYYFDVRSYNDMGESLESGETYAAIPSGAEDKILIVNGFDRSTNTSHNYLRKYVYHLKSLDLGFSYVLNECVFGGDLSLENFSTIIWMLGDESTIDETFNAAEQDSIKAFLRRGGNLFVSGSEIGWDLDNKGSSADKNFYHNFLKAQYIYDAPDNQQGSCYTVEGLSGKIFRDLSGITFDDGTHGTFNVDWPDVIMPTEGAIGCLKFEGVPTTQGFAGISYQGLFPEGTAEGKLVHLTIPYETIYPSSARQDILDRVFEFFHGDFVAIENQDEMMATQFELYDNYPNPFNPTTTIHYSIPKAGKVKLSVYNVNGELVRTLEAGSKAQGNYNIRWNALDNNGMRVSAGTYFYQLIFNQQTITKKMLLLK
jgi:hypothetical protein